MSEEGKNAILHRLEGIAAAAGGRLTPSDVIADAEHEDSPLHKYFQWDDALAAFQYRLEQARFLIRSVRISYEHEGTTLETVAFIRDPRAEAEGEQGYISVLSIKSDKQNAREAVIREFGRAKSALARAREIAVVLGLESEIESLVSGIGSLIERIELGNAQATA